jgi:hypothetical protein
MKGLCVLGSNNVEFRDTTYDDPALSTAARATNSLSSPLEILQLGFSAESC